MDPRGKMEGLKHLFYLEKITQGFHATFVTWCPSEGEDKRPDLPAGSDGKRRSERV